ncbi:MAG TPA: DegQ family serine endoprotease [Anaeromyxobacteraceae bacterium]|nr:DegQ family serine endoprotease [Anaeromyxobacteraceae bacterium]
MRRIAASFVVAALGTLGVVFACHGDNHAEAESTSRPALFQDAAAQTGPAQGQPVVPQTSLAPLIERLKPAVVNISTTTKVEDPHRGLRMPRGQGGDERFDEFFERYFGRPMPEPPEGYRGQSLGSGFILNKEGFILTNNHVVENATDIRVRLNDKREFSAKIVGRDPLTDVALIQLSGPPKDLPSLVLGDSDALRQGDFVLALGSPFGLNDTATLGIVSAKHRVGVSATGQYDDFIQTDAAINPGNSGGPLFNLRGEVVGLNTAIVSPQIGSGIGFAVPINLAKGILPQLREKGKVVRGYVGVSVTDLTHDLREAFRLPQGTNGALVQQVVENGPAAKAGLKPGDVIVAVNGRAVEGMGDVTRTVAMIPPGQKATLTILREGKKQDVSFAVVQRPDEQMVARGAPGEQPEAEANRSAKLGVRLAPLTPEVARQLGTSGDQGVVVADVTAGGPAERAGLQRGDIILEVNRQPVTTPEQIAGIVGKMKDGEMALLRVRRGDAAVFVPVPVGGRP